MSMTFDEIITLLNEPHSMERTITYITKRRCWPYPPYHGRSIDDLPEHMREHQCNCFNCGERRPKHAGTCWGNMQCEIWVCADCAPKVQSEHQKATGE